MTVDDIKQRLKELRSEQLRTTNPRTKAIIRGEKAYWQEQLDRATGKLNYKLGS